MKMTKKQRVEKILALLDEHYGSDTRDYYKVYRIPTTADGEEELLINVVRDISMFNVHGE